MRKGLSGADRALVASDQAASRLAPTGFDHGEQTLSPYDEQMAEVVRVDAILEGLTEELNRCPATPRGYRQADIVRNSIFMWEDMKKRMLAYAAEVAPPPPIG